MRQGSPRAILETLPAPTPQRSAILRQEPGIRMDTILKLEGKETIHDCVSSGENPWEIPVCPHCGQVAYRIVIVAIEGAVTRKVPLCGRHFVSACLQVPGLNRYNRAGKIG